MLDQPREELGVEAAVERRHDGVAEFRYQKSGDAGAGLSGEEVGFLWGREKRSRPEGCSTGI